MDDTRGAPGPQVDPGVPLLALARLLDRRASADVSLAPLLRAVLDALPAPCWVLDADHRVLLCNPAAAAVLGASAAEQIGRSFDAGLVGPRLIDAPLRTEDGAVVGRVVTLAAPAPGVEGDAHERVVELQALTAALAGAATPEEVASVALERARPAFGATGGLLNLVSEDGTELLQLRTVGFPDDVAVPWRRYPVNAGTPGSKVLRTGQPVFVESMEDAVARFPRLAIALHGAGYPSFAVLPLAQGGRVFGILSFNFAEARAIPLAEREQMRAFAGQCAQALARARLYEQERAARAEAEEANRAKMQFLATMSHELRTPLNAIGGYADLLDAGVHGEITDAQRDAIGRIRRSARHLLGLINDVLNFARLEAGHVELHLGAVVLQEALGELEAFVAPQRAAKRLEYTVQPGANGAMVRADAEKLRQILLNLLSNAIKFTPAGGAIEVTTAAQAGRLRVAVRDTGIGIPAERLDDVFEPFVQLDRTLTSSHEGAGLGLAISRDLARAMGGDLEVASRRGEGSTFTLTLPAA